MDGDVIYKKALVTATVVRDPTKIVCVVRVPVFVGPCHHVMARPQVADGGTASDMEGSCE